jgi:hypothetical protein
MDDPEPVELRRQPGQLDLDLAPAQPAGFEQPPPERRAGERA